MIQAGPTLKKLIEDPWSPASDFLPTRTTPEQSGNSPSPFRASGVQVCSPELDVIKKSEQRAHISRWSDLYSFSIPILPSANRASPPTILHLSDVHFLKGDPRPILEIQKLTDTLRQGNISPDVIVLTGDTITRMPDDYCPAALRAYQELSELARYRFAVLGNHDYHGKTPSLISAGLESAGFTDITHEEARVVVRGHQLNFYGIDDAYFGRPIPPKEVGSTGTNIVLTHNLDSIRENFPHQTDLILSGHTHWGELRLPSLPRLGVLDGMWWMNKWGYSDNINGHTRHWDALTRRTLSFVHPGLARYYVPRILAHPPGFVLHQLTARQSSDLQ